MLLSVIRGWGLAAAAAGRKAPETSARDVF